jgi:hypothetical protein
VTSSYLITFPEKYISDGRFERIVNIFLLDGFFLRITARKSESPAYRGLVEK